VFQAYWSEMTQDLSLDIILVYNVLTLALCSQEHWSEMMHALSLGIILVHNVLTFVLCSQEDGSEMMRVPELKEFSKRHNLILTSV
jgi:hypothetical protein